MLTIALLLAFAFARSGSTDLQREKLRLQRTNKGLLQALDSLRGEAEKSVGTRQLRRAGESCEDDWVCESNNCDWIRMRCRSYRDRDQDCQDTLLDFVGSSYACNGVRDSNQVDCSASGGIYNFNEPFLISFSFISGIENQYGHILGFRNSDVDSPMIAFGYRYAVIAGSRGATATLTARNNDGVFVMTGQYGHTNLATTNIPVGTEINVEFTWNRRFARATINGQAFLYRSKVGFGTYSRAQLCYGIGGGASAFVGTINNLDIISPWPIYQRRGYYYYDEYERGE